MKSAEITMQDLTSEQLDLLEFEARPVHGDSVTPAEVVRLEILMATPEYKQWRAGHDETLRQLRRWAA